MTTLCLYKPEEKKGVWDNFETIVEFQYNELPRDWENMFLITGVCYIGVLSHTFYSYCAEKCRSFIGVRYIGVPLY